MFQTLKSYTDGRKIETGKTRDCDLCIIGGGAAGITIARELAGAKLSVCLVESGGLEFEEETDQLNTLDVTGRDYPARGTRLRYFGGSSNHWGGHCVPISAGVFEKREWIPYSGWPFGIEELHPYYARAHELLEIGPYDYDAGKVSSRLGYQLFPFDENRVKTSLSRYHRQRFGRTFRQKLEDAPNISVLLYSTVTAINLNEDKRAISDVTVRTLAGNRFRVRAKCFVLATGGIENARLLLQSHQQMPAGIGNQNDLVGRFFQEHIWYTNGIVVPADQASRHIAFYAKEIPYEKKYAVRAHLVLSESQARDLAIPEYRVELQVQRSQNVNSLNPGKLSVRDILHLMEGPSPPSSRKPGDGNPPLVYAFANYVEQVPNPNSRITLSPQLDALGQNRASLHWQLSALDKKGIERAQTVIAREFGRTAYGRMRLSVPKQEATLLSGASGGNHHMGTTRMHSRPEQGVVDADCRIHGLENIFVAGSSVFPVSGFANPTLTITALALRLADHLKTSLNG